MVPRDLQGLRVQLDRRARRVLLDLRVRQERRVGWTGVRLARRVRRAGWSSGTGRPAGAAGPRGRRGSGAGWAPGCGWRAGSARTARCAGSGGAGGSGGCGGWSQRLRAGRSESGRARASIVAERDSLTASWRACPAGKVPLGGGWRARGPDQRGGSVVCRCTVGASRRRRRATAKNGWSVTLRNNTAAANEPTLQFRVWAICAGQQ